MRSKYLSTGLVIFLVPVALIYIASFTYTVGHAIDDGIHIVAAKSLATGQGLRMISDPSDPPATQFPPGLSLLLAPVLILFPDPPDNIIPLKLISTLFALLYVGISWFWFRRLVSVPIAMGLTILVAINPETVRFSGVVIAEMCYAAVSMLALLWFERSDDTHGASSAKWRFLVLSAVMMTAAYLFRSVGLGLILAILAMLVYRRRWVEAIAVAGVFVVLASPWLFKSALIGTPEYRGQFWLANLEDPEQGVIGISGLLDRAWQNAGAYMFQTIPVHLFPTLGSRRLIDWSQAVGLFPVLVAARLALTFVVCLGFWRRLRTGAGVVELYAILYFGMLLIWHTRLQWKYMAPITPILLLYMFAGIQWICANLPRIRSVPNIVIPVVLGVMCAGCGMRVLDSLEQGWMIRGKIDPYAPAYGWLKQETAPSSLLMGIDHPGLFLYTGRKAVAPAMSHDHDAAMGYIQSQGTHYFIVSPGRVSNEAQGLDELYLRPVIKRYPERFSLVYTDPDDRIQIYRVHPVEEQAGEPSTTPQQAAGFVDQHK